MLYTHSFLSMALTRSSFLFFFNDTATTEIYTLSLHDALPIFPGAVPTINFLSGGQTSEQSTAHLNLMNQMGHLPWNRSEEHTSELQSRLHLVCRLLLEKKKQIATLAGTSFRLHLASSLPLLCP